MEGILEAGKELEFKNCVHRDIKPDNFLFIPENYTVKLSDFGESACFGEKNAFNIDTFAQLKEYGANPFLSPEML